MKYLLLITLFLTIAQAKEATVEQKFSVQTVKVKQSSHTKSMTSYGFVKADDSLVYDVAPRFGGYVEALYADKIYKKVQMGEALAKVYSPEVSKAKDDYLNTINFSKIRPNKEMLSSSKTKLELLDIPHAEINAISTSGSASPYTTIVSPANGYVFKKSLNNNASFSANKTIFEIVSLDRVWVELKVHQNQLELLNKINSFKLTTPSYKQTFSAKKSELYPELDQKEESFTLRLEVDNKELLLKPGMYMSAQMSSDVSDYLTLPSTAVIRKNGKFFVFSVGEYVGEYAPKEVEAEVLNPDIYIIKSGLNDGDEVVNNALFMMDSDAQINALY
ncbi:MAG: efflux RND transporter periplasmic adaptor subunit [Sulfurimonas sp.]|nr:efflux RND transporter periplasmic adaptor subunit [Sulfurimonas sp.]